MDNGFIVLHRKMMDWEWYDDPNVMILFIHLLFKANWQDKRWRGIEIKRGQCVISQDGIGEECGLSPMQTRTALAKLQNTGEVNKQSTSRYTLIEIVNYNQYQDRNNQITNKQQTDNKPITTTKQLNKENKENKEGGKTPKEITSDFFGDSDKRNEFFISFLKNDKDKIQAMGPELEKFVLYWTEPTQSGKKQRWQTEKTFEVQRRLYTWLSRAKNFQRPQKKGFIVPDNF